MTFRALVVDNTPSFSVGIRELSEEDLPPGEVTIRVEWSSVNYKDGLATTPNGRVVRSYPMVPGVDLAGTVLHSGDSAIRRGTAVAVCGCDLGTAHFGGFAEMARVPAEWVVPLPAGLTTKEAMAIGTAGLTAALSIEKLEQFGLRKEQGTVIVTGATGGVGSTAVSMLAGLGYRVAGSTGKADEAAFLRDLGANEVLSRDEVSGPPERPLETQRWSGAVDPVGGATTAYLLRTTRAGGSVAVSGLTGGRDLNTTVLPFIIRGVNLIGIEAVWIPPDVRTRLWQRVATQLRPRGLMDSIAVETDLDGVLEVCSQILAGRVRGRTLVRLAP